VATFFTLTVDQAKPQSLSFDPRRAPPTCCLTRYRTSRAVSFYFPDQERSARMSQRRGRRRDDHSRNAFNGPPDRHALDRFGDAEAPKAFAGLENTVRSAVGALSHVVRS